MLICGRHWWHQSIGFVSFGAKQYPFIKQELFFNERNKSVFMKQNFTADLRVPLASMGLLYIWLRHGMRERGSCSLGLLQHYAVCFVLYIYIFFIVVVVLTIQSLAKKKEGHSLCFTGNTLKYCIFSQASHKHVRYCMTGVPSIRHWRAHKR